MPTTALGGELVASGQSLLAASKHFLVAVHTMQNDTLDQMLCWVTHNSI